MSLVELRYGKLLFGMQTVIHMRWKRKCGKWGLTVLVPELASMNLATIFCYSLKRHAYRMKGNTLEPEENMVAGFNFVISGPHVFFFSIKPFPQFWGQCRYQSYLSYLVINKSWPLLSLVLVYFLSLLFSIVVKTWRGFC